MSSYVVKTLVWVDMLACSLIWQDSGITISSMTGLALRKASPPRWAKVLGAALDWIQPGHCEAAINHDRLRAISALAILKGFTGKPFLTPDYSNLGHPK